MMSQQCHFRLAIFSLCHIIIIDRATCKIYLFPLVYVLESALRPARNLSGGDTACRLSPFHAPAIIRAD